MSEEQVDVEVEGESRPSEVDGSELCIGKRLTKSEASECLTCVGRTFRIVNDAKCFSYPTFAYIAMEVVGRQIADIGVVPSFTHVIYLDLSNNRLSGDSLKVLKEMPQLKALILDQNFVECVASVPELNNLQLLSVKQNFLTTCEMRELENLMYLDLSYNNIEKILPHLWCPYIMPKLTELSMRRNGLKKVAGFLFSSLVSLFLGDNQITEVEGLELLTNLQFLHLRNNPLKSLDGFSSENRKLFYLNLRDCQIETENELLKLRALPRLHRIVVTGNPFWVAENSRVKLLAMLPGLERINKEIVQQVEREEAAEMDFKAAGDDNATADKDDD